MLASQRGTILQAVAYLAFVVWIVGAVIAGMYFSFDQKRQCIRDEGWLKGWLWCSTETNFSYTANMLRGMIWPVDVAYAFKTPSDTKSPQELRVSATKVKASNDTSNDDRNTLLALQSTQRVCEAGIHQAKTLISDRPDIASDILRKTVLASARSQKDYLQLSDSLQVELDSGLSDASQAIGNGRTEKEALRSCLRPVIAAARPDALTPEGRCHSEALPYFKFAQVRDSVPHLKTAIRALEDSFAEARANGIQTDIEGPKGIMTEVYQRKNETPSQIRDSVYNACLRSRRR